MTACVPVANDFEDDLVDTALRTSSERRVDDVRERGGIFVEAVRLTRMPMIVTDATLPGNPIIFANEAFIKLSGYSFEELMGQDPHFMNGDGTDPAAVRAYEDAMAAERDANLEIVQYKKSGEPFRTMLFASALDDGQGTIRHHFLSFLDISRRYDAEQALRRLTATLEATVAARTRELQEANTLLAGLLTEKETLLAEVNHRAKNSLAIASALLGIQSRRQADPKVKALFAEAQDRLMAMARVHDLLSKSETSQSVDLSHYLGDLCAALRPITERDDCVDLVSEAEEGIAVHADVAVPIGIIATELITNAVKYAFPPPACGTIRVEARQLGKGEAELVVSDGGVGMAEVSHDSLGYGLVETLVRQIGGTMQVRGERGVCVAIHFPHARRARA